MSQSENLDDPSLTAPPAGYHGGMSNAERILAEQVPVSSVGLLLSFVVRLLWLRFGGGKLPLNEDLFVLACISVGIALAHGSNGGVQLGSILNFKLTHCRMMRSRPIRFSMLSCCRQENCKVGLLRID